MRIFVIDTGGIVDRILNQQKREKEERESAMRGTGLEAAQILPAGFFDDLSGFFGDIPPPVPPKGTGRKQGNGQPTSESDISALKS